MTYVITNGDGEYILNPRLVEGGKGCSITQDLQKAIKFTTESKANNYLRLSIPKNKKFDGFKLATIENSEDKHCLLKSITINKEHNGFEDMISQLDISIKNLQSLKKYLTEKISYYDTMQSEFYHLFENGRFPAHIRSQLDKKFDECLRMRRRYKMQFAKLTSVDQKLKTEGVGTVIDESTKGNGKFIPSILIAEFNEYERFLVR